jgi:predicted permease
VTELRIWASRLGALFHRGRRERELREELRLHLEMQVEDNLQQGMSPEEARFDAMRKFGPIEQVKEEYRDRRGVPVIENGLRDLRHSTRVLRRAPGFTLVAIATLAVGIGAGTSVFSVVNAVLLSSLAVPNPQDLRVLQWTGTEGRIPSLAEQAVVSGPRVSAYSFPYPLFTSLRDAAQNVADVFGFIPIDGVAVRARGDVFAADGVMVSDNFFEGLGVQPVLGRLPAASGGDHGATSVVITHEWWERLFAREPGVLGQAIILNGSAFEVIGVLPSSFAGVLPGERREFYVSTSSRPQFFREPFQTFTSNRHWWVRLMARLRPGSRDAALVARLTAAFAAQAGEFLKDPEVLVLPGRAGLGVDREHYARPLLLMLVAVGLVMLVACANLAGLAMARGAARQHELAVRVAIGAGRWPLVRQALVESLLLALSGGSLGLLLAIWGRTAISRLLAGSENGLHYDLSLDLRVLAFSLALALVTALLAGLLPALRAGQLDPLDALQSRGARGKRQVRIGKALIVAQVGLSLVLLAGAGLYLRSLAHLRGLDPGFRTDDILTFEVNPASVGYQDAQITAFIERLQDALATVPGVESASFVQYPLLDDKRWSVGFAVPGHDLGPPAEVRTHRLLVGERFFETMGIPLVSGRAFRTDDTVDSPKVAVVNEAFVRKYLPGQNPLGQVVKIFGVDWQVVGISRDAKYENVKTRVPETVYNSFRQYPIRVRSAFVVRTAVLPLALSDAVRKAVAAIDPAIPVVHLASQTRLRDANISRERLLASLCGALAGLSWLLSCIGVHGLMAYQVARRGHEIAIRMAIGAKAREIAGGIVRDALLLSLFGIGLGIPVVLAMSRLLESQLFGVKPHDPATLALAIAALLAVALLGGWVPARRAARVSPLTALRIE